LIERAVGDHLARGRLLDDELEGEVARDRGVRLGPAPDLAGRVGILRGELVVDP
jgi:hypothetical protein